MKSNKKIVILVILSLTSIINAKSQNVHHVGDTLKLYFCTVWDNPEPPRSQLKIKENSSVLIISRTNDKLNKKTNGIAENPEYYYVSLIGSDQVGYLLKDCVQRAENLKAGKPIRTLFDNPFDDKSKYIKEYGQPDKESTFKSGDYESITLIWFCAMSKYISVTFEHKETGWFSSSVYTSDCSN